MPSGAAVGAPFTPGAPAVAIAFINKKRDESAVRVRKTINYKNKGQGGLPRPYVHLDLWISNVNMNTYIYALQYFSLNT